MGAASRTIAGHCGTTSDLILRSEHSGFADLHCF